MEIIPDFWFLWAAIAIVLLMAIVVEVRRWLDLEWFSVRWNQLTAEKNGKTKA